MNQMLLMSLGILLCAFSSVSAARRPNTSMPDVKQRGLQIVVAADAPDVVHQAAQLLLKQVSLHPMMRFLAGDNVPTELTDTASLMQKDIVERAFDNLILVGLPEDQAITQAWQYEARREDEQTLYVYGFGYLRGDIGYAESSRNPWLYSRYIAKTPYHCSAITLTGSTPQGVALAVDTFLKSGLINGPVARNFTRPRPNLLEGQPFNPDAIEFTAPTKLGDWQCVGLTVGGEDEIRAVQDDTRGIRPQKILRYKYVKHDLFDQPGRDHAREQFLAGFHKRAFANTLWVAEFDDAQLAKEAGKKVASAAKLKFDTKQNIFRGFENSLKGSWGERKNSQRPLVLWTNQNRVFMASFDQATIDRAIQLIASK